jgi:hypothetical protein
MIRLPRKGFKSADYFFRQVLVRSQTLPIPESQLVTWSHQGSVTSASATYESIKTALSASGSPLKDINFDIYLQGSYKNDTNIRGDSDVDVVCQLNRTYRYDISELTTEATALYEAKVTKPTYSWSDFRADVLTALRAYYEPRAISEGNKSVKIAAASGRLGADLVVCMQYRKYKSFQGPGEESFVEGIVFYEQAGREIINFPKIHYDNGVEKNSESRTNGWYKPTVRVFKNARTYLIGKGALLETIAPSYFLECLAYNVPDDAFRLNFQSIFYNVLNWLQNAKFTELLCQNNQQPLFGDTSEQWSIDSAKDFRAKLIELWNNWQ